MTPLTTQIAALPVSDAEKQALPDWLEDALVLMAAHEAIRARIPTKGQDHE